jgi:hypothetical protein
MNLSCTFFTEPTPWAFRSPNADLHVVFRRLGSRREILLYRIGAEFTDKSQQNACDSCTAGRNVTQSAFFGIRGPEDAKGIPRTRLLDGWFLSPGPEPSVFAYVKTTMHRNLYRIPLP